MPNQLGFQPSIVVPERGFVSSLVGWTPATAPEIDPFLSQPPSAVLFSNSFGSGELITNALKAVSEGRRGEIGLDCRARRESLQTDFLKGNRGIGQDEFVSASLGEALWYGKPDHATYAALDVVHSYASYITDPQLWFSERIVRANLMMRLNASAESALQILADVDAKMYPKGGTSAQLRVISIQSLIAQLDVYLQEGIKNNGKKRESNFAYARRVLDELDDITSGSSNYERELYEKLNIHSEEIFKKYPCSSDVLKNVAAGVAIFTGAAVLAGLAVTFLSDSGDPISVLQSFLHNGIVKYAEFVIKGVTEVPYQIADGTMNILQNPSSVEHAACAYKAAAASWSAATMFRPSLRNQLYVRAPELGRVMELSLLPGGYLFGIDIAEATGISPANAWKMSAMGIAMQYICHTMSGGKLKDLDIANAMRNAMLPTLYTGVAVQTMGSVPMNTSMDYISGAIGVQLNLMPLNVIQSLMLGYHSERFWQNKLGRLLLVEPLFTAIRLTIGFSEWYSHLLGMAAQMFIISPWMSKIWQEAVNSPTQRNVFLRKNIPVQRASGESDRDYFERLEKSAKELEKMSKVAGRRWRLLMPLMPRSVVEAFSIFMAYLFTIAGKEEPFDTIPEERYYAMITMMLSSKGRRGMPGEYVEQFLKNLETLLKDISYERRDIKKGLLLATAAAKMGPHADAIGKFLAANDWAFDHFALPRDFIVPPVGNSFYKKGLFKWFRRYLSAGV